MRYRLLQGPPPVALPSIRAWLRRQAPSRTVAAAYLAFACVLTLAYAAALARGMPIGDVVRDVVEVTGASIATGFLSQVGLFMWSGAAANCFVAYLTLRERSSQSARYLLGSGMLTTILLIDDAFVVHDRVVPQLFGIPPTISYAAYAVLAGAFLWSFRRTIAAAPYLLLAVAVLLGVAAAAVDVLPDGATGVMPENGLKFLAIGTWLLYFGDYSIRAMRGAGLSPDR